MTKRLILGIDQPVAQLVAKQLNDVAVVGFSEVDETADFCGDAPAKQLLIWKQLKEDIIYSDFIGMDVDWKLEAVFTALESSSKPSEL